MMHGVGFDHGWCQPVLGRAAAGHLAARMQKRTWGCVAELCPVIVIGHECCLPDARSDRGLNEVVVTTLARAYLAVERSPKISRSKHRDQRVRLVEIITFICVRLFWNQNLTWRGSSPSSRLSSLRCLSSGCGHSLKKLVIHESINLRGKDEYFVSDDELINASRKYGINKQEQGSSV